MKKLIGWTLIVASGVLYLLAANVMAAEVQYSLSGLWFTLSDGYLLMMLVFKGMGAFLVPVVVSYFGYRLSRSSSQSTGQLQPVHPVDRPVGASFSSSAPTPQEHKAKVSEVAPTAFQATTTPIKSPAASTPAQLCAEKLRMAGWNVHAAPKGWLIQKGFGSSRLIKDQEDLVYFCLCNSLVTRDELAAIANGGSLVVTA